MEFLNFFAERLNLSQSEASARLERALSHYRPARDYSTRLLEAGATASTAAAAWSSARAFAAHGNP